MTTPDQQEREGEARAMVVLDRQREEAGHELVARKQFDVANLSDAEFQMGLDRLKVRQARMRQILETVLVEGVHYGNPKTRDGRPVFQKPMLFLAGAEELRNLFRLQLVQVSAPVVVESPEYCSVTITVAIQDGAGRILAPRTGNCNTLEKRFERRDGKGFTYTDAREMLHQCYAMAEKRAATLSTREVTGATGFFSAEEEMDKALDGRDEEKAGQAPWSQADAESFARAAKKRGLTPEQQTAFIADALGGERPVTQADIPTLIEALKQYKPKAAGSQDDLALDKELAANG